MCKRWSASGHDVSVVTCAPNVPNGKVYDGYKNNWYSQEVVDGVNVIRVGTYLAANTGVVKRVASYLSFMFMAIFRVWRMPRPDIFIATSPQFFNGIAGVICKRLLRRVFVLEIRDIWPESIEAVGVMNRGSSLLARFAFSFLGYLERRMYDAACCIVTVGSGYQDKLIAKGVPQEKIRVIPNGVDTSLFVAATKSDSLRKQAGVIDGEFLVGYIGTVGLAHGLDVLLQASRLLEAAGRSDVRFVVVGDGAAYESLRGICESESLCFVRFVGRRPKAEMPEWLASLDACLIHLKDRPLFKTVLPSKMFEAAAMRKPILMGVKGCAADVLTDAGAGICFQPESAEQLLHAVDSLRQMDCRGVSFGESGRDYVCENYDYDLLASRYASLLDTLVKQSQI
jgi:glycosyltransferase involved in cell wall biosynthesis